MSTNTIEEKPVALTPQQSEFVTVVSTFLTRSGWFVECGYQKMTETVEGENGSRTEDYFAVYAIPSVIYKDMSENENVLKDFSYTYRIPFGNLFMEPGKVQHAAMEAASKIMKAYLIGGREVYLDVVAELKRRQKEAEESNGKEEEKSELPVQES